MTPDDTDKLVFDTSLSATDGGLRPDCRETVETDKSSIPAWSRETIGAQPLEGQRISSTQDPNCPIFQVSGLNPFGPEEVNFQIQETLGVGGMGTVHSAKQMFMMRDVALKRSHDAENHGTTFSSVIEEGRRFGRMDHPNIPPVHMVGKDETGHAVLIMKRIEGTDLHSMLQNPKHHRWDQVEGDRHMWTLDVIIQISRALEHAHSRSVLHRDIKTDNVMIGDFGQIFLIDWGISVDLLDTETTKTTSKFVGSPCFAAPEMARPSSPLTPATDVYLLGAMLFEVVTGTVPHSGRTIEAILSKVKQAKPLDIPPSVQPSLAAIIAKATEPNAAERYPNMSALRIAVQEYKAGHFLIEQLEIAEAQISTLRKWLKEKRTDRQTGYNFMTLAHEALALLKTVIRGGVRVQYSQRLIMENLRIQTEYSILARQFGVAKSLVAKLVDEMGPNVDWVNDLADQIAEAQTHTELSESEIQTQSLAIMFEKVFELQKQSARHTGSDEE